MTSIRLIYRSLCFHARSHFGALLGAAVGSAVLIGALVVGDSVKESLRDLALLRLGRTEVALASGDHLFRAQLALDLQVGYAQAGVGRQSPIPVAPALQLPAVAASGDGAGRANHVQVLGVDQRFWQFADQPPPGGEVPPGTVRLNQALAQQLGVKPGDEVVLRIEKPTLLSRDAPLAPEEHATFALRLKVRDVVTDRQFGRFSLRANQVPPLNAFLALPELERLVGLPGRANLLLVGRPNPPPQVVSGLPPGFPPPVATEPDLLPLAKILLHQKVQLQDLDLELRHSPDWEVFDLRSSRVFLDPAVQDAVFGVGTPTNAALARLTATMPTLEASGVLTYLVNELRAGDRSTPYSMVTAIGPPVVPTDLRDDEILINQWLADDLQAKPGETITLTYFVVGPLRALEERSAPFRVRAILPINAPGVTPDLMPDFPGLASAKNCRDWDTGLPIATARIRNRDEDYWHAYRGTPKALVTLAAGQRLWTNRFGNLTGIRFYAGEGLQPRAPTPANASANVRRVQSLASLRANLNAVLLAGLDPARFGLSFQPVREQALSASSQSQDFGQLFLGFSFFLIAAALLLMAVLFQFGLEQRTKEIGTLLALGFRPGRVRRLFWAEGGVVALAGGLLGAWGGAWYARAMLHGLDTVWSGAVGGASLQYHVRPLTMGVGISAAALVSWLIMWLALRRQARRPAHQLLAGMVFESGAAGSGGRRRGRGALWVAGGSGSLALIVLALAFAARDAGATELFFEAGGLLLIAGLAAGAFGLTRLGTSAAAEQLSLSGLGVRGVTRRRRRSLATLGLLACGSFLIASIGVFHLDAVKGAPARAAGTGGFAWLGESTQPVIYDLNEAKGREAYGLDKQTLADIHIVPFRVQDGDDASCLNLNRPQVPRLLGVRPESLESRHAFTFAQVAKGLSADKPWMLLKPAKDDDAVPAIGDEASIVWALGRKVGDTMLYTDGRGRTFKLRLVGALANSILQGNLIISEDAFVSRFPDTTGYRMFLIDAPSNGSDRAATELSRGLKDLGLELTPTVRRLAQFNAVQNTYLGTFQVLGGLGLVLGSAGLGVVVLRNVFERRGELAVLMAVGFQKRALHWLVLSEHAALLAGGLGVGVVAALVAVLPTMFSSSALVPYASLALTLGAVAVNGLVWTWLATVAALRGPVLDALKQE